MKRVLVGGVFNIVHAGHLFFLREAKKFGDYLIVVLASDMTAVRNKRYPIFSSEKRKKILEKLKMVDKVVVGDNIDFLKVVRNEKPDVIVLGHDQKMSEKRLEQETKKLGIECKVIRMKKFRRGYSVSKILMKEIESRDDPGHHPITKEKLLI
ncbi:MAG: adenylyltransferase/cytidyltransferase family protein [Candidatus Aenigmarchaeota archaeon]|nr:adenylyltransferase/cytidyltransferase family protein [Candidatus Aenigmarchaeota archaeon]